jgi:DNA-directed RNA polymerase subunit beta'
MVDAIKDIGFKYATVSGTTMAVADLTIPEEREPILETARKRVNEIDRQYRRGLLTEEEQYQRTIEQWNDAKDDIENAVRRPWIPTARWRLWLCLARVRAVLVPSRSWPACVVDG